MEHLLGVLQGEFGDLESERISDSDDGQGSGTEQGIVGSLPVPACCFRPASPSSLPFP